MKTALKALASQIALCLIAGTWVGLVAGLSIIILGPLVSGPVAFLVGFFGGILSVGVPFKLLSR